VPPRNDFSVVRKRGVMSRSNILSMAWLPEDAGLVVVFEVHHGDSGTRTYLYDPIAGAAIESGSDPKNFRGTQIG
jgi:hypothetical protein